MVLRGVAPYINELRKIGLMAHDQLMGYIGLKETSLTIAALTRRQLVMRYQCLKTQMGL
jgi:hypothetical protein